MKIKSDRHSSTLEGDKSRPVIIRGSEDWDEWMEYFSHTGNPHSHPNSYARKVGRMTVPAKFPEMFDPAWRNREPSAVRQGDHPPKPKFMPSSGKPQNPCDEEHQREVISRMLEDLRRDFSPVARGGARDKRDAEAEKRKAAEWLAEYQAGEPQPVSVSPKLAQILEDMRPVTHADAAE